MCPREDFLLLAVGSERSGPSEDAPAGIAFRRLLNEAVRLNRCIRAEAGGLLFFVKVSTSVKQGGLFAIGAAILTSALYGFGDGGSDGVLDRQLSARLQAHRFTGRVQDGLERRLGRKVDAKLAEIGRMLWFDTIGGLNDDNACGGCHSPTAGFADTQSIAIGIESNEVVGPSRRGPRNQRRSPMVLNAAFYPRLMLNSRFSSNADDPFDNRRGFTFPLPEGTSLSRQPHLLTAQAFIPFTERTEAAGFAVPGTNDDLRAAVAARLNRSKAYRDLFEHVYREVKNGRPITFDMAAAALSEFEFTLVFVDAPLDRFARGQVEAMTPAMKRGAVLFFEKAKCVSCHGVGGASNEMFSDFTPRVAGTPQIMPANVNVAFDGPAGNEDFGLEQVTGNPADRYKFRSSPLRNLALQPTYFHNGAFTSLDVAIRYHLDPKTNGPLYSPRSLASDLRGPTGPIAPVLARLDPLLANPPRLTEPEIRDLVEFVRYGLLDENASLKRLTRLIPNEVPSGRKTLRFENVDRP